MRNGPVCLVEVGGSWDFQQNEDQLVRNRKTTCLYLVRDFEKKLPDRKIT